MTDTIRENYRPKLSYLASIRREARSEIVRALENTTQRKDRTHFSSVVLSRNEIDYLLELLRATPKEG